MKKGVTGRSRRCREQGLRLQCGLDGEHLMAAILRCLMRPDREGRKMTMGESSNLGMQSQLVVELDLGWVMEEKGKLR